MRIVDLFGTYFLALILIQGLILGLVDSKKFKLDNKSKMERKTKYISKGIMLTGVLLFMLRCFLRR